jgi:CheY-like chemotaxis protein
MGAGPERKRVSRVLIVGKEPLTRDDIRILLGSKGCECTTAANSQQAVAAIEQKDFVAIILDAQSSDSPAREIILGIDENHPNLLERVLVITEEGGSPETRRLVEQYSLPHVERRLLVQQLWGSLEPLLYSGAFRYAANVVRLIFDSFRDPLPAGLRASEARGRRVLYACGSLTVDLWIRPEEGSHRITIEGQILDMAKPGHRLENTAVALHGPKGPMAHATTNEFGEFHLDFEIQPKVVLKIEDDRARGLTISLPRMEWAIRKTAAWS